MPEQDIHWVDVLSERCSKVAYDQESQTMYVQWKRGKTSAYIGVPPDVAEEVVKSWSVGSVLNQKIIGQYPMQYV